MKVGQSDAYRRVRYIVLRNRQIVAAKDGLITLQAGANPSKLLFLQSSYPSRPWHLINTRRSLCVPSTALLRCAIPQVCGGQMLCTTTPLRSIAHKVRHRFAAYGSPETSQPSSCKYPNLIHAGFVDRIIPKLDRMIGLAVHDIQVHRRY